MSIPILEVENLKMHFPVRKGLFNKQVATKYVVDGISFKIENGQTLALVGESGCGKSVLLQAIVGLIKPTEGTVFFKGKRYDQMKKNDIKEMRRKVQLIFQDSLASLHPRFTINKSLEEPLILGGMKDVKKREKIIVDTLNQVGLDPEYRKRYPEQLSGGQRQRENIARALVERPELILADEPISALDVSLQAQVLNFLMDLQEQHSLSMLFVAHDLAVVRQIAEHIMIMYAGVIVESAPSSEIYNNAKHPYTKVLLESAPSISKGVKDEGFNLNLKIGDTVDPASPPKGCLFNTRCIFADKECYSKRPKSKEITPNHFVSCHKV